MAITSPGVTLAIDALFGCVKPQLDIIRKLGPTDFSADAPGVDVKPGATIKVPLSTVEAASAFDASSNNYLTGGNTTWGSMTATHFLQGYDVSGADLDEAGSASRVKQLFSRRAGIGISMAMRNAIRSALNGTTTSTGVKIPVAASATLADYDGLAHCKDWFDPADSCLVVNGAEYGRLKSLFHAAGLSVANMAQELGFREVICLAGMTARACIVPFSTIGFIARVPTIVAKYQEAGTETDEDSGLSIGIVVADEQKTNRIVVNGDVWFGVQVVSAPANAGTPGIINVGTAE